MDFQRILEESITHGITKFKDIWRNLVDNQEFQVWEEREWWERLGLGEEVDMVEESLNNRHIRMHPGEDKLYWVYGKKIFFTMKEAYKILIGADIQPIDQKWGKLWKKKPWPNITVSSWLVIRN